MPHSSEENPINLTIRRPDDWHVHLRDGEMLQAVAPYTARQFGRAIVMPNLPTPITKVEQAKDYRARILAALPEGTTFEPLMTAYLTDTIAPFELEAGFAQGVFTAAKLYPAHATTGSQHGVTSIDAIGEVLETMQRIEMPLLVHGEVTSSDVDIFDREAVFIETVLAPLLQRFPGLRVVLEHITTEEAADFVMSQDARVGATITPHHLEINRNAIFAGGLRPHMYCLPTAKREKHRLALRKAATSGNAKFFLGTDSAPHERAKKESDCGCAGIFNAPFAIESYAKVFAEENALDKLEGFASEHGPAFYRLPLNEDRILLQKQAVEVPARVEADGGWVRPFHAGASLPWRFGGAA